MESCYITFSHGTAWYSRFIEWFTKSKASHCFIVFPNATLGDIVLESSTKGHAIVPLNDYPYSSDIFLMIESPVDLMPAILQELKKLDEPYDYPGLLGMAWVYLGRWLHKKWKNPLASVRGMWCSELVATVLKNANYPGFKDVEPTEISPQDLIDLLKV